MEADTVFASRPFKNDDRYGALRKALVVRISFLVSQAGLG